MDAAAHYRHLLALGREEFLAAAAPAALVRYRAPAPDPGPAGPATLTMTIDEDFGDAVDETMPHGKFSSEPVEMELFPIAKKPGASFPDRITIGRTTNNDVVVADHSVSRLHAYVRRADGWVVADAGSKNGSWLDEAALEPRREMPLHARSVLRLGDVRLTFYRSEELFDLLGGDHGRR
jgi:hypothetical protein